jgi:hypothetical protein
MKQNTTLFCIDQNWIVIVSQGRMKATGRAGSV